MTLGHSLLFKGGWLKKLSTSFCKSNAMGEELRIAYEKELCKIKRTSSTVTIFNTNTTFCKQVDAEKLCVFLNVGKNGKRPCESC
jgi:hypothetical protein